MHMELSSKQNVWNYIFYILDSSKWPPFAFNSALHTLQELQELVPWNDLEAVLNEFPEMLSTGWPFCL